MGNSSDQELRYSYSFVIWHPDFDPTIITKELQWEPTRSWRVGEEMRGVSGNLTGTTCQDSIWIFSEDHCGDRNFFAKISSFVQQVNLVKNKDFLRSLVKDGARINFDIRLPGDVNIGDQIDWPLMGILGDLNINLSIEVFPEY